MTTEGDAALPAEGSTAAPAVKASPAAAKDAAAAAPVDAPAVKCHTRLGKGVYDVLFNKPVRKRNEFFEPGRMAFVVELTDDPRAETDIPTTLMRSKAQCVSHQVPITTTTTKK